MNYKLILGIVFLMLVSCGPQNNSDCVIYDDFYVGIQQVSQDKWDDALNDEFKPRWDDWDCSYEIHFIINNLKTEIPSAAKLYIVNCKLYFGKAWLGLWQF